MHALLPLALLLSTVAFVTFRRAPAPSASGAGVSARLPLGLAIAGLLTGAAAVFGLDIDRFSAYELVLVALPRVVPGLLGLVVTLGVSVVTARLFLSNNPGRGRWIPALALATLWCGAYVLLPIHLSAPDFDDYFIVGKLAGGAMLGWENDKPLLTTFDLPYCIGDLLPGGGLLERFRVNGWFTVLYVVNLALVFQRIVGGIAVARLGRAFAVVALAIGLAQLGPVVLSHTVAYELAGATLFLLAFNAIETLRTSAGAPLTAARGIAAVAGLAVLVQATSNNANAAACFAVYFHALLAIRTLRAPGRTGRLALWAVVIGVADMALRLSLRFAGAVELFGEVETQNALLGAALPLVVILTGIVVWTWRTGLPTRFLASFRRHPSLATIVALYFAVGMAIYMLANQGHFGMPVPGQGFGWWPFGTNHARYAAFFYPFLAAALAAGLIRVLRHAALVVLLALTIVWNRAYVVLFYGAPPRPIPVQVSYHRNTQLIAPLERALAAHDRSTRFAYVQIPRDHGDHYLLRSLWPDATVGSVCDPNVLADSERVLIVTGHTLDVLATVATPCLMFRHGCDERLDVALFDLSALDEAAVRRWCDEHDYTPHRRPPPPGVQDTSR